MLLIKRLLTALVLVAVLFVVLRTGALMVGGGIMGARASAALQQARPTDSAPLTAEQSFNVGLRTGMEAGVKFRQDYWQTIGWSSLGVATVGALWLTFGGKLPWCREVKPPPLPNSPYYPQQSR